MSITPPRRRNAGGGRGRREWWICALPTLMLTVELTRIFALSLSHSLTLSRPHFDMHLHCHALSLSFSLILSLSYCITLASSHSLTPSLSHSLTLSLSHSLTVCLSVIHISHEGLGSEGAAGRGKAPLKRASPSSTPQLLPTGGMKGWKRDADWGL